jgi:hypothetical protein
MNLPKNINKLCEKCECTCKQADNVHLITCPNFVEKPVQLTIFDELAKKKVKKTGKK